MGQPTQPYKQRSIAGSIGSGMKSVLGGSGRRFYILEHKVSSKFHKAGEEQRIIVDEIELGRDAKCQVRFDESFGTVSRRHAAIVKDGDNWKLVQLSKTNSTYLNGRRVEKEWYLQSGDEIQLSTNGPKLSFIVPQGDKSLVKSIGLTARMSLFRKQALRPYKQAIMALACFLICLSAGGGYVIYKQSGDLERYRKENISIQNDWQERMAAAETKRTQDSIRYAEDSRRQQEEMSQEIARERQRTNQILAEAERRVAQRGGNEVGFDALLSQQNILKDVYFLQTEKVVIVANGTEQTIPNYGWSGTGFLLSDGRFVTARHCIEGWLYQAYDSDEPSAEAARTAATNSAVKMKAYFIAVSSKSNIKFNFTSDDFRINHGMDQTVQIGTDDYGNAVKWTFPYPASSDWNEKMWSTDWAYTTKTGGHHGDLLPDGDLSRNLIPMQRLVVLGFPQGIGVMDGSEVVDPISNELTVSRQGLANNGCILHSRGTDHGNSGGPIFAIKDDRLVVVGIVSRGDVRTEEHNWAVPICNIN